MKTERTQPYIRLLTVLLCALLLFSGVIMPVSAACADTPAEILTVGVPVDRCPIFYQDDATGAILGIGVEMMRSAAAEAGYAASFRAITEETLKSALDNPDYDIILPFGSAITSASGAPTLVTDNLMQTPFTFVTEESRELPARNSLRVGMLRSLGGAVETLHQLYPDMQIMSYETMADSVKALRGGKVDALLHNSYVWSYVLQKPAYEDLVVHPSAVFSMDFRAGTPDTARGREMIERLNGGIAALSDTRRQAVILDYTSKKLYKFDFSDYLHEFGLVYLLAVLLFVAVIVIAVQQIKAVRKEEERKRQLMLDYDPLTGVLSMSGFRKRVEELLHAHPDSAYFLSYNNIRDFKFINDSLGRAAGDDLLKMWAKKTMENLTEEEAVGRITADHFVVLRRISGEEQMREDEKQVFEPVCNFFINQGKENRVQICSGIYVLTPKDYRKIDVDHMLDLARVAEKRVRESRSGDYAFYNPEQWEKGKRISDIVNYLPKALRDGDIQVFYQPQVNYETGEITGAEALCRWDHTKLGWLHPEGFISTLEDAGLIYDLDRYVWETVCRDLQRWNEQGSRRFVSVNVSRGDIREDRDVPGYFYSLVQKYGVTPDQLRIEITETAYVESPELLIGTTEKLRAYGFQVEMDDFGSGYSSLHMLKEVPVDRIKLDLHFLTESGDPEKCRTIVSCMIQMMQLLGLKLIAEGVETAEQASFLQSKGCAEMQGYYFYKPLPVRKFENVMKAPAKEEQ